MNLFKHKPSRLDEVNQYADILWKLVCTRDKASTATYSRNRELEQKRYDRMIAKTQLQVLRQK